MFLAPTDAVRVWEERGALRPTVGWREMMHEQHASAFTVAKIAKLDLLSAVQESLDTVIREGGTFEEWKRNILPELQRAGWWGVVNDPELTGTTDTIVVNDRRLRTIYRTNVRMSIAAGRWRKYQREKDLFPYLRYLSDHYRRHPRLNHQSWHGIILPVDDPTWQWMFPPNGWGCNCRVEQVSEARMQREGWRVSEPPQVTWVPFDTPAGEIMTPGGVAPGFGYNPGTAHLRVLADRLAASMETAIANGLSDVAEAMLRETVADETFVAFARAPEVSMPAAIIDPETAAQWGMARRVLLVDHRAAGEALDEVAIASLRLLPDIASRAIIAARTDEGLIVWYEAGGGAAFRARILLDEAHAPKVVELTPTTIDDAAAESADMDIIFDRGGAA